MTRSSILAAKTAQGLASNSQEQAYRYLKHRIINLEIKPNDRLTTQTIASAINVSRTPVREALGRLEQEGLAVRDEGWGYTVKPISMKEAMDVYRVREVLEVEAVRQALPNVTPALIARLRASLNKAEEKVRQGRLNEFRNNARLFYHMITEATGNSCLISMLATVDDRIRLLGAMMAKRHLDRPKESLAENRALLEALGAGDERAAIAAVRKHVASAAKTLTRYVMTETGQLSL